jgi:hypothetical protein
MTAVRSTEGVVAASVPGPADRGEPPATVSLVLPAHLSLLATVRAAVAAVVREVGGSGACAREMQLAADEAAAVLIEDATPWTELTLAVAHDEADVYVRLVTRRARPGPPLAIHELTQMLLDGVVASSALFPDGERAYAFLETPKDGAGTWM